jgi:hypothetical protein
MIWKIIPIRIKQDRNSHKAQNGPLGVNIATGTRYFAAVLAQEVYEASRYMAWYWLPTILFAVAAFLIDPMIGIAAPIWMLLVGRQWVPTLAKLERRELIGQAIEIACIRDFYGRKNMASEYALQARSIIVSTSSYAKKGMFKTLIIEPDEYTPQDAVNSKFHASIAVMIALLRAVDSEATQWTWKYEKEIRSYMPIGEYDRGY